MKSLRDEINSEIEGFLADAENQSENNNEFINKILKLIEKRIDSIDEWAKPRTINPKELDKDYFDAFNDGFQEAVKIIKQELLKE